MGGVPGGWELPGSFLGSSFCGCQGALGVRGCSVASGVFGGQQGVQSLQGGTLGVCLRVLHWGGNGRGSTALTLPCPPMPEGVEGVLSPGGGSRDPLPSPMVDRKKHRRKKLTTQSKTEGAAGQAEGEVAGRGAPGAFWDVCGGGRVPQRPAEGRGLPLTATHSHPEDAHGASCFALGFHPRSSLPSPPGRGVPLCPLPTRGRRLTLHLSSLLLPDPPQPSAKCGSSKPLVA